MSGFFELLHAGARMPAAILARMVRAARARPTSRCGRRRLRPTPASILSDHLRRDIGLRPVDSRDLPL